MSLSMDNQGGFQLLGESPLDKYSLEIHGKRAGGMERSSVPPAGISQAPREGLSPFSAGLPQKPLDMESTTGGMIDGQTQQRSGKELISWQKSKRQAEPSWAISPRHSRS